MDIIRFILNNGTNPCDNMNISLCGQHHNEERTNIYIRVFVIKIC